MRAVRSGGHRLLRRRAGAAPAGRRAGAARGRAGVVAARGFKLVDAFPFKSGDSESRRDHYHGALSMFLAAGFALLREDESLTVVREAPAREPAP